LEVVDVNRSFLRALPVRRLLAVLIFALAPIAALLAGDPFLSPPTPASAQGRFVNSTNFASIQAAIDSVRDGGGAVYVPAGTYVVPEKVRLYSNVTLFGDGMDRTIIRLAAGVVDHLVSNNSLSTTSSNIVIRDLTLSGTGVGTGTSCCYGLRLVNVRDSAVINVASDGFALDGFYSGVRGC
jgi:pectin methylesterase-like acyl-CoA thioesterase